MYNFYKDKKVLVTGANGFKGSWLVKWLQIMGADVHAIGRKPSTEPSHSVLLGSDVMDVDLSEDLMGYYVKHIGNPIMCNADIVFHFAAHSIVTACSENPHNALRNNIMATVNLLELIRISGKNCKIVLITSDKVYADKNWYWGYRENDELGGLDPYSTSKVCIEHVAKCYRECYGLDIAIARAGNVIGGGDWNRDRLIPDIVRAASKGVPVEIATPEATRPWQHVLDVLHGYLLLGKKMCEEKLEYNEFNFGPSSEHSVADVLELAKSYWDKVECEFERKDRHPHMVSKLRLDSTLSHKCIGWTPFLSFNQAVKLTIEW